MKLSALDNNTMTKQFNSGHPLCLRGMPGMAKTARILAFAKAQGLGTSSPMRLQFC